MPSIGNRVEFLLWSQNLGLTDRGELRGVAATGVGNRTHHYFGGESFLCSMHNLVEDSVLMSSSIAEKGLWK